MEPLEIIWFAVIAGCSLLAVANWRAGIYAGIIIDAARDPVRKLLPNQPVHITLSGVIVWILVIVVGLSSQQAEIRRAFSRYPQLRTMCLCLLLAILPAAMLSIVLYAGGYLLAAIGCLSYVAPLAGIGLGFLLPRSEKDVDRMMTLYTLVNSVMLIGVPLEYLNYDIAGLGGIEMDWIRHRPGQIIELMSGFHRSPDIMGLHAAHVIMFSMLLALRTKRLEKKAGWLTLALWAAFCVLVSGRRKMIGIPLVFLASYLLLGIYRRVRTVHKLMQFTVVIAIAGAAVMVFVWSPDQSLEYTDYASSLFTEGTTRANDLIIGSSIGTFRRYGLIGAGIGTATQGRYYVGVATGRGAGWQEDGVSRLILELGLTGFLLLGAAGILLILAFRRSLRFVPPDSPEQALQVGLLSVVAGNFASYAISHQQFSGDPVSAILATIMAGAVLGMPRVNAARLAAVRSRAMATAIYRDQALAAKTSEMTRE